MNLFTKEEIEQCILTKGQANWFKRESKLILCKDETTGSEVLVWVKPTGKVFIERIDVRSPDGPELNFHHPDFKHFQSERWSRFP